MGFEDAVQYPLPWWTYWVICSGMVSRDYGGNIITANVVTRKEQQNNTKLAGLNTLTFSVWISRGAGLVLSVDGAMILLPMCRNMLRYIRPKVKFLPLDESQWFHRQVAYSMLIYTIVHVCGHYVK